MTNRIIRIGTDAEREKAEAHSQAAYAVQHARMAASYWKAITVALVRRLDPEGGMVVLSADEVGPERGSLVHEDLEPSNGDDVGRVRLEVVQQERAED